MKIMTSRWGLSVLATLVLAQAASAITINYSVEGASPPVATTLFGPNGVAAGTQTWNQSGAQSVTGLLDAAGAATGVNLNLDVSSSFGVDDWGIPGPLSLLNYSTRDFATTAGNFITMTLSGLTTGDIYNVWVASGRYATVTGGWTTTNTTSTLGTQLIDNSALNNPGTWVQGNNYVLFEDVVVNGNGELVMTGVSTGDTRLPFSGFQVVQVPEPSAALLGGLGVLALLRRRRA